MIAITGHTSGLGKELFNYFLDSDPIGFSRSNGYDINDPANIIQHLYESSIFINNAYDGFAQVDMLYSIYDIWKNDSSKTIISISSNSSDGIKTKEHPYAIHKAALDKASQQLAYNKNTKCKIINIKPGWIDIDRVNHITEPKIEPIELCKLISFMISTTYNPIEMTILPR